MSLKEIELPNYKLRHELWNSITHGLGGIFAIVVTILCLIKICNTGFDSNLDRSDPNSYASFVFKVTSIVVYGICMLITYTISCIYHALAKNNGKRVFRVLDHDTVYLLIGGTYTPYCLISLRHANLWGVIPYAGFIIFAIVWILIILGIVFNSININKFKVFSFICYIVAGWAILIGCVDLYNVIGFNGFMLLLFGGISYTIGSVLYGIGSKKSIWWHTVFHIFVVVGTILQFVSIYLYVI